MVPLGGFGTGFLQCVRGSGHDHRVGGRRGCPPEGDSPLQPTPHGLREIGPETQTAQEVGDFPDRARDGEGDGATSQECPRPSAGHQEPLDPRPLRGPGEPAPLRGGERRDHLGKVEVGFRTLCDSLQEPAELRGLHPRGRRREHPQGSGRQEGDEEVPLPEARDHLQGGVGRGSAFPRGERGVGHHHVLERKVGARGKGRDQEPLRDHVPQDPLQCLRHGHRGIPHREERHLPDPVLPQETVPHLEDPVLQMDRPADRCIGVRSGDGPHQGLHQLGAGIPQGVTGLPRTRGPKEHAGAQKGGRLDPLPPGRPVAS